MISGVRDIKKEIIHKLFGRSLQLYVRPNLWASWWVLGIHMVSCIVEKCVKVLVLLAKVFPCVKRRRAECHVTEFSYAECHYCVCHAVVLTASLNALGNCDIHAEQKISSMNETKWYEICLRPKGWAQKIFQILLPNFCKGHKESCRKFHLFCKAWTKVSEMQQILFISFLSHIKLSLICQLIVYNDDALLIISQIQLKRK